MASSNIMERGTVVITGTSTGIGRACALSLDKIGFQVFAGVRKKEDGAVLKQESSERLTPIIIDVTDNDSIARAAEIVRESIGEAGLAGLVNNAGSPVMGPIEFIPIDKFMKQVHVNLIGHVAVIQAFLPLLRKYHGRIINIGSIGGIQPVPFNSPYGASKAAMENLTDSLRMELRPWNIPVTIVIPGNICTEIWKKARETAVGFLGSLPEKTRDLYGSPINSMVHHISSKMENSGNPPEAVARVVIKALLTKKPKTRYIVGWDARLLIIMGKFVSDRIRDRIMLRYLGLAK